VAAGGFARLASFAWIRATVMTILCLPTNCNEEHSRMMFEDGRCEAPKCGSRVPLDAGCTCTHHYWRLPLRGASCLSVSFY
jgi:hypothetical protein